MSNKLQATFHPDEPPHTTGTMIDAIQYPLDDDDINVTERARPIINAMLAEAWDQGHSAGWNDGYADGMFDMEQKHPNPYRSQP